MNRRWVRKLLAAGKRFDPPTKLDQSPDPVWRQDALSSVRELRLELLVRHRIFRAAHRMLDVFLELTTVAQREDHTNPVVSDRTIDHGRDVWAQGDDGRRKSWIASITAAS